MKILKAKENASLFLGVTWRCALLAVWVFVSFLATYSATYLCRENGIKIVCETVEFGHQGKQYGAL